MAPRSSTPTPQLFLPGLDFTRSPSVFISDSSNGRNNASPSFTQSSQHDSESGGPEWIDDEENGSVIHYKTYQDDDKTQGGDSFNDLDDQHYSHYHNEPISAAGDGGSNTPRARPQGRYYSSSFTSKHGDAIDVQRDEKHYDAAKGPYTIEGSPQNRPTPGRSRTKRNRLVKRSLLYHGASPATRATGAHKDEAVAVEAGRKQEEAPGFVEVEKCEDMEMKWFSVYIDDSGPGPRPSFTVIERTCKQLVVDAGGEVLVDRFVCPGGFLYKLPVGAHNPLDIATLHLPNGIKEQLQCVTTMTWSGFEQPRFNPLRMHPVVPSVDTSRLALSLASAAMPRTSYNGDVQRGNVEQSPRKRFSGWF